MFKDDGLRAVGDGGVDLDAAVDRAGMHDEGVPLDVAERFRVDSEEPGVFAEAGEIAALLAFELDAEQVDDVGVGEGVLEVVADADADLLEFARDERGRSGEGDVRAELDEAPDVAARDAAVEDVAHDDHVQALDAAFLLADGEDVEQGLRRVAVGAVAGVHHAHVELACEKVRCAGGLMAD